MVCSDLAVTFVYSVIVFLFVTTIPGSITPFAPLSPYLFRAVGPRSGFLGRVTRNVRPATNTHMGLLLPRLIVIVESVVAGPGGLSQILVVSSLLGLGVETECPASLHVARGQLGEGMLLSKE